MSKATKTKSKLKRRNAKATKKAAQRAKYEGFKASGKNTKSARAKQNARKNAVKMRSHPNGACGNIGCRKCNPNSSATNAMLASPGSCIYGKRWSSTLYNGKLRSIVRTCRL